jgi:RES domain-containing protein
LKVWRLSKAKYAESAFEGVGAKKVGGRWNTPGQPIVYTSEHLSLAVLELLVHVIADDVPPDIVSVWAEIDDDLEIQRLEPEELPEGWRRVTGHAGLKGFGDRWQRDQSAVAIAVPSVVVPEEYNILLNPEHPEFAASVTLGEARPFSFDTRLFAG